MAIMSINKNLINFCYRYSEIVNDLSKILNNNKNNNNNNININNINKIIMIEAYNNIEKEYQIVLLYI